MERLYVADRTRLRAVCKDWHLQPNHGIKAIDKLPWTMEYKWRNPKSICFWSVCKLYEPLHHNRRRRKNFTNAQVRASRSSWVLFSKEEYWRGKFFFFNPFTKRGDISSLLGVTCRWIILMILFNCLSRSYLLECDGDLLLVYLFESLSYWLRKEWVRVSRLGGRAMFLGETSFCPNRVYYHHDGVPEFQTLDLCSFDEYDYRGHDYLTWRREKKTEWANAKIYGCRRKSLKTIWIQPPRDL
ncbi:hypothetical protein PVL29_018109 [Vitis rotundifolia]|uniref:Uncharacterized protein n=1 Tax=Vitis rotundifolia TaxID=103349 RepID=A0AA38Z4S1_VITRO|nr:hypothetical protein PVL29_018109 [Vitis rotundifolia]